MKSGNTLNILYMLPELTVGGVETHVTALSAGIRRLGHNVTVISNGGPLVPRLESQNVEHITLPIHRKSAITINEMAGRVRQLVRERNIQVVHAHSRVPAWITYFALRNMKVAFITSAHGQYAAHIGSKVMTFGDRIICVSKGIMDHMEKRLHADPAKMVVIYNGINMAEVDLALSKSRPRKEIRDELGLPRDATVAGSIGRLTTTKGPQYFIDAFHRLKERRPDMKAVLVGDGPIRKDLEERVAELGLEGEVLFTGVRTDIFDILKALDIYVVSSIYEGFPMGCLEAMASRVPIVATCVGGIPEMIEHGRTALLAEPRDPDGLATQMEVLAGSETMRARLTDAGFEDVSRKFSEEKMIRDVLGVYHETIRAKKGYIGPVRGVPKVDRPRILLTLPELRVGGVETHMIDLARGLKRKGYDPLVVSFGGKLVEKLEAEDVKHVRLPVHSKNPLVIRKMIGPMKKVLLENNVELVHAHSRVPAWICYVALRMLKRRIPFLTTCHSTYSVHVGSRVMNWSDNMIAVSEFVMKHMLDNFGTDPSLINVVHNGVSPTLYDESRTAELNRKYRAEFDIPDGAKVVGMVASLTPRKGYVNFLGAAGKIKDEIGNVFFIGVGGGPQREELEHKASELGLDDSFKFLGIRNDVRDMLPFFDVFVLSSWSEGLPYVILEAMCMRRPIVTTDVGGIPEAIKNRENGMLVKPGDDDALAASIMEVIEDESLADMLGGAARRTVATSFTVEKMVDKTESIYKKILN